MRQRQVDIVERDLEQLLHSLQSLYFYAACFDNPTPYLDVIDIQQSDPDRALFTVMVANMPLRHSRYQNDNYVDVIFVIEPEYPLLPPNGLYISDECDHAGKILRSLKERLNAFSENASHGARAIPYFSWICLGFGPSQWNYCHGNPKQGDSITTLIYAFYDFA